MGERWNSVLIFCRRNQAAMTDGFVFHLNSIFTQNQTPVNDFTDLFVKKKRNMQSSVESWSAMISLSYNYGDLSKKCLFGFMKASDHHCIGTLKHFLRTRERATAFKFALIFTGHGIRLETINLTQKSRDKIMDDCTNFKKSFILATIINLSQDEWLVCISS